jgi:hypothetical protein
MDVAVNCMITRWASYDLSKAPIVSDRAPDCGVAVDLNTERRELSIVGAFLCAVDHDVGARDSWVHIADHV